MHLIVFSGLPGTGKSSLAEVVGKELGIPVFAKDWLEASLKLSGLADHDACAGRLGYAAYELLSTLALRQLVIGQSVILDSVATFERIRAAWRELAVTHGAGWRVIECICSDETVHRKRLAGRRRGIPGWPELDWREVERVRECYDLWQEERLVVDAVEPFDENLDRVLRLLRHETD